jgi:hypothetical protein
MLTPLLQAVNHPNGGEIIPFRNHQIFMPGTHENGSGDSRLDRLEGLMALLIEDHVRFSDEHKRLLTAQVLLTEKVTQLADAQKHTDDRLNALITIVDGVIRQRPPQ